MHTRPPWTHNWKQPNTEHPHDRTVNLSRAIFYDKQTIEHCQTLLAKCNNVHDYADDWVVYNAICKHWDLDINTVTVGFGASDIMDRCFRTLNVDHWYIVTPHFLMASVFCGMNNCKVTHITRQQAFEIEDRQAGLYIANPGATDGECVDISNLHRQYKYLVADEVYADFYPCHSLINNVPSNTVVLKSLGKTLGLGGFRCGFGVASTTITNMLQDYRSLCVCTKPTEIVVPELLPNAQQVIERLQLVKQKLQSQFPSKPSTTLYMLFKEPNQYTRHFGARLAGDYYRIALADWNTLDVANH